MLSSLPTHALRRACSRTAACWSADTRCSLQLHLLLRAGYEQLANFLNTPPSSASALAAAQAPPAPVNVRTLHTYTKSLGVEVAQVVATSSAKLLPLLPPGYTLVPAAALGFGTAEQGIVAIANFRGTDPAVDGGRPGKEPQVAIDVGILIAPPAAAAAAGVAAAGAYHFYLLKIYTDDAAYAASLRDADMPVELLKKIVYLRTINDTTGIGTLAVVVPDLQSPLASSSTGISLPAAAGAFDIVFWYDGAKGTAVLYFHDEPWQQGQAVSRIYTLPGSRWANLLAGGGLGPCGVRAGLACVSSPALNLRYGQE